MTQWKDCTEAFPDYVGAEIRDNGDGTATVRACHAAGRGTIEFRLNIDRIYSGILEKVRR